MRSPALFANNEAPLQVLCLGAHCDDIEIGCGATILRLVNENSCVNITWVVFASNEVRAVEAEAGAALFLERAAKKDIRILSFRDGFLPFHGVSVKEAFEELKHSIPVPDVIFTHYREDLHQDHRLISQFTWNTFRNHLILEYEIPKWDGDLGTPNSFVSIPEETARKKINYLQKVYNSQNSKQWFTDDLFWSMLRIRGIECVSESNLAEGFYARKIRLD